MRPRRAASIDHCSSGTAGMLGWLTGSAFARGESVAGRTVQTWGRRAPAPPESSGAARRHRPMRASARPRRLLQPNRSRARDDSPDLRTPRSPAPSCVQASARNMQAAASGRECIAVQRSAAQFSAVRECRFTSRPREELRKRALVHGLVLQHSTRRCSGSDDYAGLRTSSHRAAWGTA